MALVLRNSVMGERRMKRGETNRGPKYTAAQIQGIDCFLLHAFLRKPLLWSVIFPFFACANALLLFKYFFLCVFVYWSLLGFYFFLFTPLFFEYGCLQSNFSMTLLWNGGNFLIFSLFFFSFENIGGVRVFIWLIFTYGIFDKEWKL